MRFTTALVTSLAGLLLVPAGLGQAAQKLGLNVHQSSDVGLDAARDSGTDWVRIDFNWYDAQPTSAAATDWSRFDTLINAARARNLEVLAVIGYTPAWASSGDIGGGGAQNDVPTAGSFGPFVTAAVNRYKDRVTHWEIWNEPNLMQFFAGTPQQYIDRILVPGADAVHAACATCKVIGPGLASVGGEYATWMDMVLAQAAAKLDIVSGHIYAAFTVDDAAAGLTKDSFFNKLELHRKVLLYEGPLSYREVMLARGVDKPFWLTETGREAAIGNTSAEASQALLYRRVLEAMLTRPWWDATFFYEAFDEPGSGYTWGVVMHDPAAAGGYRPKQAFALLTKAARSPAFGGTGSACDDGLDNDGDNQVDFPADSNCASATAPSEGALPVDAGVGVDGSLATPDAAVMVDDGGNVIPGPDAGTTGGSDAGTRAGGSSSGCSAGASGAAAGDGGAAAAGALAALLLGAMLRGSRRRRCGPWRRGCDRDRA